MKKRTEREAREFAHAHTQYEEGQWLGEVTDNPVATELVRRYNEASGDLRACPHLQADFDQARFWVEAVPELLACKACTPAIAAKEQEQMNTCCLMCGRHTELRGMTAAVSGLVLRGGICADCQDQLSVELPA